MSDLPASPPVGLLLSAVGLGVMAAMAVFYTSKKMKVPAFFAAFLALGFLVMLVAYGALAVLPLTKV